MRKMNVFGKKLNQIKIIYLILGLTLVLVGLRFYVSQVMERRLDELKRQQQNLQTQINLVLASGQSNTYHEIGAIIQYLPNTFNQAQVTSEFDYVKNLSGLPTVDGYQIRFDTGVASPFTQSLPSTLRYTLITVNMTFDGTEDIFTFIDNLLAQDRLYYIESISASRNLNEDYVYLMKIYTFHNDVTVD
jgi:hypothetical protein